MEKRSLFLQLAGIFGLTIILSTLVTAQDKVVVIPLGGAKGNANVADVVKGKTFSSNTAGIAAVGTRPPAPVSKIHYGDNSIGVPLPNPRFTGNLLTGYIDQLTGLHWAIPGTTHAATNTAVFHCNNLEVGIPPLHQLTDWRLPDIKELLSIIDYSESQPALIDGHPFGTIHNDVYWTITANVNTLEYDFWTINLTDGSLELRTYGELAFVWCVRGGVNN